MLGKAICEISALNKKAVGVPDSSMLIPRASLALSEVKKWFAGDPNWSRLRPQLGLQ